MMFVLLTRYTDRDRDDAVLEAHRSWLIPRYEDGTFLFSGGFGSFVEGVDGELSALAVLQADSYEEAKAIVDSEPFYLNGHCTQVLLPFTARVRTSGLDEAFGDDLIIVDRAAPAATPSSADHHSSSPTGRI